MTADTNETRSCTGKVVILVTLVGLLGACMPAATAISSARGVAVDTQVTIEGHVTVPPGTFASATEEQGFALQDGSGGIYVSLATKVDLALDTKVRVTGQLKQVNEQTQLTANSASVQKVGDTMATSPKDVSTGSVNESVEGQLVRITGHVTKPVVDDRPYGYKVFVNDGSGEIQVFVHIVSNLLVIDVSSLATGVNVKLTGLAGQYQSTYEVMPRIAGDLVILP